MGIKVNLLSDFDAEATEIGESNPSDSLLMPQRVNLHKVGLRRSKRMPSRNPRSNIKLMLPTVLMPSDYSRCLL